MKKVFRLFFYIYSIVTIIVYLGCSASAYLKPSAYFFSDAFALGFPFLLAALIVVIFWALLIRQKRTAFFVLIVLLCGYNNIGKTVAFHPFHQSATDSSTRPLKVMTWNVFYFLDDHEMSNDGPETPLRKMMDAIRTSDADVLCMQEYLSYQNIKGLICVKQVLDSMGYKYSFYSGVQQYGFREGHSQIGTIIYSKIPFSDSGRVELNDPPKERLIYIDVQHNNKPVRIFTAHLSSLGLYADTAKTDLSQENIYAVTYLRKGSIARKLKHTGVKHEIEAHLIDSALRKSPYPAIFCADMNSAPTSYAYRIIRGNMQDAFLKTGFGFGQTYDALSPTLRIDVCFASPQLEVLDCTIKRLKLSDHFPVITTIK
ncbi:MAG: endonuclease/exonuclease/phosphatase family protein [Filimonas sp.]|nr:endonuclease/exonuclease/phosphatase family protein [Filimonas sp.]